ncbi:MAG: radical SAM protein [bacterium]
MRDYIYYDLTQSMCRECRRIIDAQIIFRDNKVYLRSICPDHGASETIIASDITWYLTTINRKQITDRPAYSSKPIEKGCPFDCGLCAWHEKACNLPIFSITNVCNLHCPICFTYNRSDTEYYMSVSEFEKIIDWIIESEGSVDLINITGGEPTLHPELLSLLKLCERKEIGRVTLNSNGITLAHDEKLVEQLAEHNVYVILSFNTFKRDIAKILHGEDILTNKLKALEHLKNHNVQTTLLNVGVKDINDSEIGQIIDFALDNDFIRSVTIQTMTYTGFGGSRFLPREHLTIDRVIANIVTHQKGLIKASDFSPMPGSHPLCYSVCYLFHDGNYTLPLRRLFNEEEYSAILGKKYLIHPDDNFRQIMHNKINEVWVKKDSIPQAEKILSMMKRFITLLYPIDKRLNPFERQAIAEKFIKTIYIHAHMDEDNFDLSRIARCGDLVPTKDKSYIPACTYNLLYRMKDQRFWRTL